MSGRMTGQSLLARLVRARTGAAAVEMAFLAPILVFMAAGLIDFGLGIYTRMMVADAAQAGAAYAQLNAATYGSQACTSNASCTFDTNIVAAATKSHGASTAFSSAVQATAIVMSCCLSGGVVQTSGCTQPPTAAPTCTPTAGTYVQVVATAQLNTLLPYNFASRLLNFSIPNPIQMSSTYLVRIQ